MKDWRQEERGWQGMRWLMASPTQWTWVWGNSGRWWRTGRPGVLQSMGSCCTQESDTTQQLNNNKLLWDLNMRRISGIYLCNHVIQLFIQNLWNAYSGPGTALSVEDMTLPLCRICSTEALILLAYIFLLTFCLMKNLGFTTFHGTVSALDPFIK